MKRVISAGIVIVVVLALSLQPSSAAQRGSDDFSKLSDDVGKPLPRTPSVDPGSIEKRSALAGSSILKKAKHDPAAKAASPRDHRKRMLAMFGRNPVRFNSTTRSARDLSALKQTVAVSSKVRPTASSGGLAMKVVGATLCVALVALMAVLLIHRRREAGQRKPIRVHLKNAPIDLTVHLESMESFERQIRYNLRQNKGRKK